jgi:hypothetical protein
MKNKALYGGMILLVFALVFLGCKNTVQDVRFVVDKAPSVSLTQVAKTADFLIFSWDAVENALWYRGCIEKEGQKTPYDDNFYGGDSWKFDASGTGSPNDDPNKWYAYLNLTASGDYKLPTGKYRFGIQVYSVLDTTSPSDIEWTDWYTF